ncbi:MAG: pyrroline-5-carboxylate reductase [Rickettsiales bacterium]|nr:pyrroline-5-carboxylate reductase [Rickettsiales bacterium]
MTESIELLSKAKVGFIGAGNMAASILGGLIQSGLPAASIYVSNRSAGKLDALKEKYPTINTTHDNAEVVNNVDYVLLAVKPQIMSTACADFKDLDLSNKCAISVAAGVTCETLNKLLGADTPVVRSMPNTPSLIGYGATGLYANDKVSKQQRDATSAIFDAVGKSIWVDDEDLMDVVTAVSGSGPAHYFLFMESVVQGGMDLGLPEETARELAAQTALGAAAMVQQNGDTEIGQLRRNVTSPGGTTAAALDTLNEHKLPEIVKKALEASVKRGKELADIANQ